MFEISSALVIAVLLLLFHFVGDFVFQSTDMAVNKAKSIKWLSVHVGVYTLVLGLGSLLILDPALVLSYAVVNGLIHLVTDFFTSKLNARLYQRPDKKLYYTGIGFDQLLHSASLLLTFEFMILR